MLKAIIAAAAVAALSACASVPPNPIAPAQRATLKMQDVKVAFADTFKVPNMTVRMRYFDQYKAEHPDIVAADPEANETRAEGAVKRAKLTKEYIAIAMREEVKKSFAAAPSGPTPANINLMVNTMGLTGGAMTILVGKSNSVGADATIVDAGSGAALGSYNKIVGIKVDQGGLLSAMIEASSSGGQADDAAEAYAKLLVVRFNSNK